MAVQKKRSPPPKSALKTEPKNHVKKRFFGISLDLFWYTTRSATDINADTTIINRPTNHASKLTIVEVDLSLQPCLKSEMQYKLTVDILFYTSGKYFVCLYIA